MTTKQQYPIALPGYAERSEAANVASRFASKPAAFLFPGAAADMLAGDCTSCGQAVAGFKDQLSLREWEISGMCQTCQDQAFTDPED